MQGESYRVAVGELARRLSRLDGIRVSIAAPIAARHETESADRATVAVWVLSVVGSSRTSVSASFSSVRLRLVRTGRGWLVDQVLSEVPGPVPSAAQGAAGLPSPPLTAAPEIATLELLHR
jgi:hypothetical protein